jgi:hypothetical protein
VGGGRDFVEREAVDDHPEVVEKRQRHY